MKAWVAPLAAAKRAARRRGIGQVDSNGLRAREVVVRVARDADDVPAGGHQTLGEIAADDAAHSKDNRNIFRAHWPHAGLMDTHSGGRRPPVELNRGGTAGHRLTVATSRG